MANIVINDLHHSIELDKEAMAAITGGAVLRGGLVPFGPVPIPYPNIRLINFSLGTALSDQAVQADYQKI